MRLRTPLAGVAVLAVLAGCGDGKDNSLQPSPSPRLDVAAATAEITKNWRTVFDGSRPGAERIRFLQTSPDLRKALRGQDSSPISRQTRAIVRKVVVRNSGDMAEVTYDLLVAGRPFVLGGGGTAVLIGDTWKVSKATFCGLTALIPPRGREVPGCA